jgi:hypothetical protein
MARYSGPALAAGAISKAIGDVFEGLLAGERGGLAAEKAIGEQGLAEREMALKGAAFPTEMALARAQTGLLGQQQAKTAAEAERLYRMTPEEIAQARAETRRTGSQADIYGQQSFGLGVENRLRQQAIDDWAKVRTAATGKGKELSYEDILAWARRHPVLMQGANAIPAAALMDLNTLELYLKQLQAQDSYKGPRFLLDAQQQAHKEAGDITTQALGKEAGPEAADMQAWLTGAFRNRILNETLGQDAKEHIKAPGPAPRQVVDYVFKQLQQQHPGEDSTTLRSWTYEILAMLGMGAVSWQAAFQSLRQLRQPAPTKPGAAPASPPKGGYGPPAAGPGPSSYRYNPATGDFK